MIEPAKDLDALVHRIGVLETKLVGLRLTLVIMSLGALVLGLSAWRGSGEVKAKRLLLTDEGGAEVIAVRGVRGPGGPAVRLETPAGQEILLLGPAILHVR